jgi:hypothetical protein
MLDSLDLDYSGGDEIFPYESRVDFLIESISEITLLDVEPTTPNVTPMEGVEFTSNHNDGLRNPLADYVESNRNRD